MEKWVECAMDHYQKESLCFEIEDHFIIPVPGTHQFIVLDRTTRELHYMNYGEKKKLDTLESIRSKLRKETVLPIINELSDEDPESVDEGDKIDEDREVRQQEHEFELEIPEEREIREDSQERVYLPEVKKVVIIDQEEYEESDLASN